MDLQDDASSEASRETIRARTNTIRYVLSTTGKMTGRKCKCSGLTAPIRTRGLNRGILLVKMVLFRTNRIV